MNATELRIGNIVVAPVYRSEGLHQTVVETISKGWGTVEGKSAYTLCINHEWRETGCEWGPCIASDVQPIPLTEEWLLKLGFILDDEPSGMYCIPETNVGYFDIQRLRVGVDLRERFQLCSHDFAPNLDYVHQLQNLYFALTGKELNIR